MIRIDVTRATRAIVKSANFGVWLFFFYFGSMTLNLLLLIDESWLGYLVDPRATVGGMPAHEAAVLVVVLSYCVYGALYYLTCVRRLIVLTELLAVAMGISVGTALVMPIAFVLRLLLPLRLWSSITVLLAFLIAMLVAVPHIVAAHRFRAMRRRLRTAGVDLALRPWRKASFRAQMRVVSRWRVAVALALSLVGVLMFSGVGIGLRATDITVDDWTTPVFFASSALILSGLLIVLGHRVMLDAHRRSMRRLGEAMAGDRRAPVLLLRSFRDDPARVRARRKPVLWPLVLRRLGSEGSFEEVLTIALADTGPVVAIGRPGETQVPVGAAREYLANDAWQGRIQQLVAEAALVVILIGDTPGLAWETEHLLAPAVRGRVLFVVPPVGEAEAARRWSALRSRLAQAGADLAGLPEAVTNVVVFSVEGAGAAEARLYVARDRTLEQYELALMLASHERLRGALPEPLLRRLR